VITGLAQVILEKGLMIMIKTNDIAAIFREKLKYEEYVTDKNGGKVMEIIGASFEADKPAIFGTPNDKYIKAEIDWYIGQDTNINAIDYGDEPPKAWQGAANDHGEINSNYGKLIFSDMYYRQFENVINELRWNMDTRRASMVYQRPSIWVEFNDAGKNDFICTNAVTYYIRKGKIDCVVQMRSNDVVFGYKNDYAWQKWVLQEVVDEYNATYLENAADADYRNSMEVGTITWQVQNLHVYERHFHLVA